MLINAFRITIKPIDPGQLATTGLIKPDGNNVPNSQLTDSVRATEAQIKGVLDYLGHIQSGADTSSVETAVNAL